MKRQLVPPTASNGCWYQPPLEMAVGTFLVVDDNSNWGLPANCRPRSPTADLGLEQPFHIADGTNRCWQWQLEPTAISNGGDGILLKISDSNTYIWNMKNIKKVLVESMGSSNQSTKTNILGSCSYHYMNNIRFKRLNTSVSIKWGLSVELNY